MQENPPNAKEDNSPNAGEPETTKKVLVYKGDKDKPTKAEWILILITFVLAVCNVLIIIYASNQTQSAIDAVNLARDQFVYQRQRDSINTLYQFHKDSILTDNQQRVLRNSDSALSLTRVSFDSSYKFTRKSLAIAESSLAINNTGNILSNSPYVWPRPKLERNDSGLTIRIIFTNSGKTPAIEFGYGLRINYRVWLKSDARQEIAPKVTTVNPNYYGVLYPQDTLSIPFVLKKIKWPGIQITGQVDYRTIFDTRNVQQFSVWIDGTLENPKFTWEVPYIYKEYKNQKK